jgi:hypothetical protein
VVVDFDNGDIQVRCAPFQSGEIGYDVLRAAGFAITNVQDGRNGAALCSIDNVPDHICTSMPPTSAYWAYFHVSGGEWGYSSTGGGGYHPKPGSVEGWHWRGSPSDPPQIDPPVTTSTPTPTSHPTSHPTSGASNPVVKPVSSGHASSGGTPTAPDATVSSSTGTPTAGSTGGPTDAATATDDVAAPEAQATDAAGPGSAKDVAAAPSSGNHSWIWGVVLVAVLGGAAATTAIRRRRA